MHTRCRIDLDMCRSEIISVYRNRTRPKEAAQATLSKILDATNFKPFVFDRLDGRVTISTDPDADERITTISVPAQAVRHV